MIQSTIARHSTTFHNLNAKNLSIAHISAFFSQVIHEDNKETQTTFQLTNIKVQDIYEFYYPDGLISQSGLFMNVQGPTYYTIDNIKVSNSQLHRKIHYRFS